MIEKIEEFKKIQQNCSNIFLIDENLCIGNTYELINYNFTSLSAALISFNNDIDYFNGLFTYFSENSSKYLEIKNNLKSKTDALNNLYTTVSSNSSFWTKDIGIFYNEILSVPDWNANKNSYPQTKFLSWINSNFPPQNFNINQNMILYVNLYQELTFRFDKNFKMEYYEGCSIPPMIVQITCQDNSCTGLRKGCNYERDKNKHRCFNAFDRCIHELSGGGDVVVQCPTTGSKNLTITHRKDGKDKHMCTSMGFLYKKINDSTWGYINKI
jgi:hypothetical protein